MLLVVDTNVAVSFLVRGNIAALVLSPMLEIVTVDRLFMEIERNKDEILGKSCFSAEAFETLLELLRRNIEVIPMDSYISFLPEAERLLGEHRKDAHFVALALQLDCPLWSYEKRFRNLRGVTSLDTADVIKVLKELS